MTAKEKQEAFLRDLNDLLGKYDCTIGLDWKSPGSFHNAQCIVVDFEWSKELFDLYGSGHTLQLVLGSHIGYTP